MAVNHTTINLSLVKITRAGLNQPGQNKVVNGTYERSISDVADWCQSDSLISLGNLFFTTILANSNLSVLLHPGMLIRSATLKKKTGKKSGGAYFKVKINLFSYVCLLQLILKWPAFRKRGQPQPHQKVIASLRYHRQAPWLPSLH